MKKFLTIPGITVVSFVLLFFAIKGKPGNPLRFQNLHDQPVVVGTPFELSNSNARYALTETIVNNHTLSFSKEQAKFAAPDVVMLKGKFFSVFTPGVSFIGVPFSLLGKFLGIPQILTFFTTILFAVINMLLITWIVTRLKGNVYQGLVCGLIFLFATNAFPYALTYTQHHFTVTVILLLLSNVLRKPSFLNNIIFGILVGIGILLDLPNIFLMMPICLYKLLQHIHIAQKINTLSFAFKPLVITIAIGVIPLLAVFGWYNFQLTGSFIRAGQTIPRSVSKAELAKHKGQAPPNPLTFTFKTRRQLDGFYTLLVSDERGMFYFSPILLLGILGMGIAYMKKEYLPFVVICITLVLINIILYSMFIDPWGGWAFGPRYLIPASAVLACFISFTLRLLQKKILFSILFFQLLAYSVWVHTLGAMTTVSIPPKIEAIHLLKPIPYTYEYNFFLAYKNFTSSLAYQLFLPHILSVSQYINIFSGIVVFLCMIMYLSGIKSKENNF